MTRRRHARCVHATVAKPWEGQCVDIKRRDPSTVCGHVEALLFASTFADLSNHVLSVAIALPHARLHTYIPLNHHRTAEKCSSELAESATPPPESGPPGARLHP